MSAAFNTSSEDPILAELDTVSMSSPFICHRYSTMIQVLGDLLTLARQLIDLSASLPAEMVRQLTCYSPIVSKRLSERRQRRCQGRLCGTACWLDDGPDKQ